VNEGLDVDVSDAPPVTASPVPAVAVPARPAGWGDLEVSGICKSFGAVRVLDDVSFRVQGGEFVTLLGPSGCGKTTLLRIIAGLERPDRGQVILSGRPLDRPAHQRPINTVFQNYALFPHLSVFENIAFGLRSRRCPASQIGERVGRAMAMLRIEPMADRRPHQLSGGQKQRVALARALVNEPEVLLLDEPMSALDAKLRAEVQIELRRLQRRLGKTFILVTHDQDEAMTVSDRVLVMQDGRIEQMGTPAEVYDRPRTRFVAEFLGAANLIRGSRYDGGLETPLGVLVVAERLDREGGTLAIRPERVRIVRGCPPVNGVRTRIRETIYRGDHVDVLTECGLRARTPAAGPYSPGQEIWLELPPEHLVVLAD